MTIQTGAQSTYDEPIATGGNREDLSDVLYDVTPTATPFLTAIKKVKATGTNHEWLSDALLTGQDNKALEGDSDATAADPGNRTRLGNYTQILRKHSVVTGTQEAVLKGGGIRSEMAYQVTRRLREIKTDFEFAAIGQANAKVGGAEGTAREMGALESYLINGVAGTEFAAATSDNPTGNSADTATYGGDDRAFTEAILTATLQNLFTNSGGNSDIMAFMPAKQKGVASTFTGANTRYASTDDKRLVNSIDVYDGDFHTVTLIPDRFCKAGSVFLVDKEYMAVADLRPIASYDLAKTGDNMRKEIVWETTLEVCDPNAHAHIFDLS